MPGPPARTVVQRVAATAAALVSFWHDRRAPLILMSVAWIAAISYGVTRTPASPGAVTRTQASPSASMSTA